MIQPEVAAMRDALLKLATNSDSQATKWAFDLIEHLDKAGYTVIASDALANCDSRDA